MSAILSRQRDENAGLQTQLRALQETHDASLSESQEARCERARQRQEWDEQLRRHTIRVEQLEVLVAQRETALSAALERTRCLESLNPKTAVSTPSSEATWNSISPEMYAAVKDDYQRQLSQCQILIRQVVDLGVTLGEQQDIIEELRQAAKENNTPCNMSDAGMGAEHSESLRALWCLEGLANQATLAYGTAAVSQHCSGALDTFMLVLGMDTHEAAMIDFGRRLSTSMTHHVQQYMGQHTPHMSASRYSRGSATKSSTNNIQDRLADILTQEFRKLETSYLGKCAPFATLRETLQEASRALESGPREILSSLDRQLRAAAQLDNNRTAMMQRLLLSNLRLSHMSAQPDSENKAQYEGSETAATPSDPVHEQVVAQLNLRLQQSENTCQELYKQLGTFKLAIRTSMTKIGLQNYFNDPRSYNNNCVKLRTNSKCL